MEFAIITEKYPGGNIKTLRSSAHPLTPELERRANALDTYLTRRIPEIERELIAAKLLEEEVPKLESIRGRGNVLLWHALGTKLRSICERFEVDGRRERSWLWEAMQTMYATSRITRASRGRTRSHFEYCFRLSRFPVEFAEKLNWSEWVYFFDSRTVREDQRADDWVMSIVSRGEPIGRKEFRRFTERLNKRVLNLDTSVLTRAELFALYDSTWAETKRDLMSDDNIGSPSGGKDSLGGDV